MKKDIFKASVIIILLVVLCVGLYYYLHPKKALQLVIPDFTGENFINVKVKNDTAYVNLQSYLNNNAPYRVDIDSIFYKISLDTFPIIVEHKKLDLSQNSGSIDTALLQFSVPLKKFFNVVDNLKTHDSTFIKGYFAITFNTLFGKSTIDFSKKKSISAPVPPEVEILKINNKNIDVLNTEATISVDLKLINHSPLIDINLSDTRYTMHVGKQVIAKGLINNKIIINPKSSTNITVPLQLDIDKPLKTLWDILVNNKKKNFSVTLKTMLSNNKLSQIPLELEIQGRTSLIK